MIFYVTYAVAGSRCNGSYLVRTGSKADAEAAVKKLDEDYVKVRATKVLDHVGVTNEEVFDQLEEVIVEGCVATDIIDPSDVLECEQGAGDTKVVHLESGT